MSSSVSVQHVFKSFGSEQAVVVADLERVNASIERKTSEAELLAAQVATIERNLETMKKGLTKVSPPAQNGLN